MKKNEPFNPMIKSKNSPEGIIFRVARREDSEVINKLTFERNQNQNMTEIEAGTTREMDRLESDVHYKLYVAQLADEVIGFCRFAHSLGLPSHKKIHPAPEGWYGLGILVAPAHRRQNIAKFLHTKRVEVLKELGAKEFYSVVDTFNLTSMKMHVEFGYIELERASGFLHFTFKEGLGCLFRLEIK